MRNFVPRHKFHPDKILKQKLLGGRSLGLSKARSVYPVTSLATLTMTQKSWCYVTVTYPESWISFALSVHIYHSVHQSVYIRSFVLDYDICNQTGVWSVCKIWSNTCAAYVPVRKYTENVLSEHGCSALCTRQKQEADSDRTVALCIAP
jgi:hypothetical protein